MRKRILYTVIVMACISLSSFKKDCNNPLDKSSIKKELRRAGMPGTVMEEVNFSPINNLLKI